MYTIFKRDINKTVQNALESIDLEDYANMFSFYSDQESGVTNLLEILGYSLRKETVTLSEFHRYLNTQSNWDILKGDKTFGYTVL
jgi:hypothetical protein